MNSARYAVEAITTKERFAEIRTIWNELVHRAGLTHPFLTHEWLQAWIEAFGAGAELLVLIVRADGQPIAAAPLMRTTQRLYGIRQRSIRFLANDHTPRCDFIIAEHATAAYAAVFDYLNNQCGRWDLWQLRDMPSHSATAEELATYANARGFVGGTRRSAESPVVSVTSAWEQYLAGLPSKRRWFLRNRLRRLSKLGDVSLETVTGGSELLEALEEGFQIEAAAWKEKAGTAIRSHADTHFFYKALAQRFAERGWLRLQFLKVGDRRIAFAYCVVYADRLYLLKPGFDPEYAEYSPGNLLCYLALQDVYASGLAAYEFLGADDHWKRQWTTHTVSHHSLFLYANRPLPRIAHYARFAVVPAMQQFPFYSRIRNLVVG